MTAGVCKAPVKKQTVATESKISGTGNAPLQRTTKKEIDELFRGASKNRKRASAEQVHPTQSAPHRCLVLPASQLEETIQTTVGMQDFKTTPAKVPRLEAVPKPSGSKEDLFGTGTGPSKLRR